MPPKKRGTLAMPITSHNKRQKPAASAQQSDATDAVDFALNAERSLLLHLPAELRHRVWELAYGDKMILVRTTWEHEDGQNQVKIHYEHYGTTSDGDMTSWEAPQRYTTPQLVSRQFWAETLEVYLSSCTFRFNFPNEFRSLALSGHTIVAHIRRVMIHVSGGKTDDFPRLAHDDFTSSTVGRFVRLEGVIFTGSVYWGGPGRILDTDMMDGEAWRSNHMSAVIRAFQQHKLKEDLTHVTLLPESAP